MADDTRTAPRQDFCHEAWFDSVVKAVGAQCRCAFVFRWLSKAHDFMPETRGDNSCALVPTRALVRAWRERLQARLREQAKKPTTLRSKRELRPAPERRNKRRKRSPPAFYVPQSWGCVSEWEALA